MNLPFILLFSSFFSYWIMLLKGGGTHLAHTLLLCKGDQQQARSPAYEASFPFHPPLFSSFLFLIFFLFLLHHYSISYMLRSNLVACVWSWSPLSLSSFFLFFPLIHLTLFHTFPHIFFILLLSFISNITCISSTHNIYYITPHNQRVMAQISPEKYQLSTNI